MLKRIEERIKKFHNSPDRLKFEILVSISEKERSDEDIEFLLKVIEEEKYEKIRIKAILTLKDFEDEKIVQRLSEIYSFERENSVRLALIEVLGSMSSKEIDELLVSVAKKDENDIVRSMAIKNLHERANIKQIEMKNLLLDVIQNDLATFPKQIALSIISSYAKKDVLDILISVFMRETKFKMKQLLYKTLTSVAEILNTELDIPEPIEEKEEEKDKKKKRRKKNKKKEEEYLYF